MVNKDWLLASGVRLGIEVRVWGAAGASIRRLLEEQLGVQLSLDLKEFAESVGNVGIGPFVIALGGDGEERMGALAETKAARVLETTIPMHFVKLMDHAGESYFYDANSEEVSVFDSLNLDPMMRTLRFSGFVEFLEWVFEEARRFEQDNESGV